MGGYFERNDDNVLVLAPTRRRVDDGTDPVSRAPLVLLVEDNPADVLLAREALAEWQQKPELQVAENGEAALERLRDPQQPRPDLVLLDLNMPRMGGFEVLEQVKADRDLRAIPILVLSTSSLDEDVLRSYHLHANAYVPKPSGLDSLLSVAQTLESFWLSVARLPGRSKGG